jgi:hypothetical protein
MLYELVVGEFLFYDPDWIRFFVRVTQPGQVRVRLSGLMIHPLWP